MSSQNFNHSPVVVTQSVQIFVRRVYRAFALVLILGAALLFFLIYKPLSSALEQSLIANFEQVSQVNYHTLRGKIERSMEGAKSLSSRTMIRDAIQDYNQGLISFEELKTFTQSKYEDGAKALENLILAERYVDHQRVASYIPLDQSVVFDIQSNFSDKKDQSISRLFILEDRVYVALRSPVVLQGTEIAYDGLVYDITESIQALRTEKLDTRLVDETTYQTIIQDADILHDHGETAVVSTSDSILTAVRFQDKTRFISQQSRRLLLAPVFQLRTRIFIVGIGTLIAFSIAIYWYVIRFAKTLFSHYETRLVALEKVAQKATIDPLTSAGNRSSGTDAFNQAFQNYQTTGTSYGVMMFDIDSFKSINDQFGHNIGDEVLKKIVEVIHHAIRKEDQLFRWGGDEFVGLFAGISEGHVATLAEKIRSAVSSLSLDTGTGTIRPTISMGISFFAGSDSDFSEALLRADKAMYQSKSEGKNRFHVM